MDDERLILDSLRTQARRRFGDRYLIECAESAEEAYEVIDDFNEDAVPVVALVADWLMPGEKGDAFLANVHKRFPGIVKMILTGQADDDALDNAWMNAGLSFCLRKPWDENELMDKIEKALEMNKRKGES